MLQLAGSVERVDVHHGQAGAKNAHGYNGILQHIRQHHGDAIALLVTLGLQPCCDLGRSAVHLRIGHRLAHADESRLRRKLAAAVLEKAGDGRMFERTDFGRYPGRV